MPQDVPDFSMAGREPPQMGPMVHGFAALGEAAERAVSTISALAADAVQAPGRLGYAAALLTADGKLGTVWQVTLPFAGLLLCAVAGALIVRRLLAPQRKALAALQPFGAASFALGMFRSIVVDAAPVAAFAAIAGGGCFLLFWDRGLVFSGTETFRMVASTVVSMSVSAWLAVVLLSLPLAVGRPGLRSVPLDDREASAIRRFIRQTIALGAASWIVAASFSLTWIGKGLPRLLLIFASLVICAISLRSLARIRSRLNGFGRIWHVLAVFSVFGLGAAWIGQLLFGGRPPFQPTLLSVLVLAALPAADGMAALLLDRLKQRLVRTGEASRRIYAPAADLEDEELAAVEKPLDHAEREAIGREMVRSADALERVEQEAVRWVLAISAIFLLAEIWSLDFYPFLPEWAPAVFASLAEAGITLLIGWYAWRLFETGLAVKLSREEGGVQSRARTVQPLLRAVGRLVIAAVALMSALSTLGLNIAPLLASAGVVGIAVGFGAQTLVRDLFSGASYLIEDVFRIGDYIEGGNAKGTVERITFRTVALRHQNGPLHFVPYGTLGSVRNNSRDWVIDKFEIPLPVTVDSERIRKLVKKIGLTMLDDPELAKIIDEPLKAKLYRIDPGVKVFRCKVQTPPGKQFEIRNEAYRRIEAALKENGIAFADNASRVTLYQAAGGEPAAATPPVLEQHMAAK
jgi:moderate conductance mechanosensitive channel